MQLYPFPGILNKSKKKLDIAGLHVKLVYTVKTDIDIVYI